jgi:hypothetical protein
MNRLATATLMTIASFVTAGNTWAADHAVQATVPFDFTVGSTLLPSGTYLISSDAESHFIQIRSTDGKSSVLSIVYTDDHRSANGGKLVFDHLGNQYFLNEILCQGAMNVQVPTSHLEKAARVQVAKNQAAASQTLVATK